jgi:hypothetical protein
MAHERGETDGLLGCGGCLGDGWADWLRKGRFADDYP